jgi:hypothetical protein
MTTTELALSWATSRERDTYGYNICRLVDQATGKRYRTMGGGYDMIGTVIGYWLEDQHQAALVALCEAGRAGTTYTAADITNNTGERARYYNRDNRETVLYGLVYNQDARRAMVDGACGESCVLEIARAIGITIDTRTHKRNGETTGYLVTAPETVAA